MQGTHAIQPLRCVGDDHEPKKFNLWGAKALSGIGKLQDTLMDRSIVLELRRKLPDEQIERLRHAPERLFVTLQGKLARFAEDYRGAIKDARPAIPVSDGDALVDLTYNSSNLCSCISISLLR